MNNCVITIIFVEYVQIMAIVAATVVISDWELITEIRINSIQFSSLGFRFNSLHSSVYVYRDRCMRHLAWCSAMCGLDANLINNACDILSKFFASSCDSSIFLLINDYPLNIWFNKIRTTIYILITLPIYGDNQRRTLAT